MHDPRPAARLIVPGLDGSGPGHWQHHWLEDDPRARLVVQADWSRPRLATWLTRLEQEVIRYPGAVLVTHSLGVMLAAHLAARPAGRLVAGALLVAPADIGETARRHAIAVDVPEPPAVPLPFPSVLVASRSDPYMAFADAARLARVWGSEVVDLGDVGHINVASGFGRWADGYRLAARLATPAGRRSAI